MAKNKKSMIKKEDKISIILLIPIMLILAIIPLIVYLKVVPNDAATRIFMGGLENNVDFFSYYKSLWFVILTVIGLFIYFSQILLDRNLRIRKDSIYYPMIAYGALIILSTVFATYKTVALRGFMDRYEGMWVWLSYLGVMFLSYNLVYNEKQLKYILGSLGFSTIMMSIIGFTQYIGKDIYRTDFMKRLITPTIFNNQIDNINFIFEANRVYASLYNPNYVGVYSTMIFTLSATIMLLTKNKSLKILSGLISVLSILMLLGSGSRAGMLTLVFYFILLSIVFRNVIIKKWKASLILLLTFLLILIGANIYSNNIVLNRFTSGVNSIFNKEDPYDFRNLYTEDNSLIIEFEDYNFGIKFEESEISFFDKNSSLLDFTQIGSQLLLSEEPYNKHSFNLVKIKDSYGLNIELLTNRGAISFNTIFDNSKGISLLDNMNNVVEAYKAPYFGFEGREQFASNRGYLWSRSLPLLKDTILLGYGPDTYGLHFPNNDYYGKLIGLNIHQQVDKPHSLYLLIAINTGVISLVVFLFIVGIYLFRSIKIYYYKNNYTNLLEIVGLAIFLMVLVFLITGITNDSIIGISPLFWILLGVGHKLNIITNI